ATQGNKSPGKQDPPTSWRDVPVDGLCCHNPSPEVSEIIRLGQDAMARKRRAWDDWMLIAEALAAGRAEVMRDVHTNQPTGRRYERAMSEWLIKNGFKEVDKGARCRLLECLQHRDEIERWRALLTDAERFRVNHPDTVLRKWKKSVAVPDLQAKPKTSAFAQLKEAHAQLIEDHHRLEVAAGGGDLWSSQDTAKDIQAVMQARLSAEKAMKVGRGLYVDSLKKLSKPKRLDEVERLIKQLGLSPLALVDELKAVTS